MRSPWSRLRAVVLSTTLIAWVTVPASPQTPLERVLDGLSFREIGPAVMGGRVADLAVLESNPAVFYVGTATGGLWRTQNHGTTWEPLFDDQSTSSIGDVTLAPSNPNVIWVGSGEPQNRQSSPWGNGVYRSTDAGKTWTHLGLEETRHISRIQVHPRNPDVAYVAAVGHLWGPNPERGVYRTTDGGASWDLVLFVDEHTGAIDLVMDPGDPETVFAAMYQRRRTNFGFNGGGPGSGIYRTTDGGETWTELTEGLPDTHMGRIGLDIYRRDGNMIFAVVQAQEGEGVYRSLDRGDTWAFLSDENPRAMYFSQIRVDPNDPERIYLGGVQLHISRDGGRTFNREARQVHSDHHALWIDSRNSDHLIMGSDGGISVSFDRAANWRMYDNLSLAQFYEVGVDMRDPYYVCGGLQDNGSWCGPSETLSRQGIMNKDWYNVHGGDGFYTQIDPNDPRIMFAESQNGRPSRVDVVTGERQSIQPQPPAVEGGEESEGEEEDENAYRWNWNTPIAISTHDPATIFVGSNVLHKSTDRGQSWTAISEDLTKAIDRSELEIMGAMPDEEMLSRHDGISFFGNITTISESALDANVLYVGTDDGNVQVTRDGGTTWENVVDNISGVPEGTYVSRVAASRHDAGTVYATFDGHTTDDYAAYVYVSADYGRRWSAITEGLPEWSVNIIAEHPSTANLLFVGNEVGAYVSIDGGGQWTRMANLPTVPVDDIIVHPRDNDLVLGTHGRGVWIMDDIGPLEQLTPAVFASALHVFPVSTARTINIKSPQGWLPGAYSVANPSQGAYLRYYLADDIVDEPVMASNGGGGTNGHAAEGDAGVTIRILGADGSVIRTLDAEGTAGLHEVRWDLRHEPPYETEGNQGGFGGGGFFGGSPSGPRVLPGVYAAEVMAGTNTARTEVTIEGDPRIDVTMADLEARQDVLWRVVHVAKPLQDATEALGDLEGALGNIAEMVDDSEAETDSLSDMVRQLRADVRRVAREIRQASAQSRRLFATIERFTGRPTADQLRSAETTVRDANTSIEAVNALLTERVPALYEELNRLGIRPRIADPIEIPRQP